MIAGRVAVALVAVIVLTATGWEWAIKSRADSGIISRSVQAIVTDDSNLATATDEAGNVGNPLASTVAFDSTANQQVVCESNTWDKAPSTTGVHPIGTSCDDSPVFTMSKSDDVHLIECDPGTRVWSSQHS